MSSKPSKGRNMIAVDKWLDSLGLYRKNIAQDETCFFRAVSEHMFECQIYHERVRKECVEYGRIHYYEFWPLLESEEDWYNHLDLLEKHMVVCGGIEIALASYKYNIDVVVYDASTQDVIDATGRNLDQSISVCLLNGDHYDIVHDKEHIKNAGFCQSIVYSVLYENVFEIPNTQKIVHDMLYDKKSIILSCCEVNNNSALKVEPEEKGTGFVAPFTFKVAKALDPTLYRNIEYDTWTRVRREMRLKDWYYGDDNLILGTRCIYNADNGSETLECYIQDIFKEENKCVVYITKLAEKRTVNYTDLSPENDAKPWPLPYRFCKNSNVTLPTTPPAETTIKTPKQRKSKRQTKSNSESQCYNCPEVNKKDIDGFIGVPLQMQEAAAWSPRESPKQTEASQHNLLVTPDTPSNSLKFTWNTDWNTYVSNDKIAWNQSSERSNVYKPMVASAPVTPAAMPHYSDVFMWNCNVANCNTYSSWSALDEYSIQNNQIPAELQPEEEASAEVASTYVESPTREKPMLFTPLTPPNPPVEVYSPVVYVPPTNPGAYAHTPEVLVPAIPVHVYTPPVDVQYVSPRPVMYLPTPPANWYPSGVNSQPWYPPGVGAQGFIFQPTVNQNVQNN